MSATLRLILWPFHNGLPGISMGAGPERLAGAELIADLEGIGWRVERDSIAAAEADRPEIARTFELLRRLAERVGAAKRAGEFPLVLAGGCNSSIGTLAGMQAEVERPGIVWFDAHADFDRTDENLSGFLDVMGVSMLTGSSWQTLCDTVPGFTPVDEADVVLAGARDLEPYQRESVERSRLRWIAGEVDPDEFRHQVTRVSGAVGGIYLHLDLDVVDADEIAANEYAATGGPSVDRVDELVGTVFSSGPVGAAALTAWDPAHDRDGAAADAARRLVVAIARGAYAQR